MQLRDSQFAYIFVVIVQEVDTVNQNISCLIGPETMKRYRVYADSVKDGPCLPDIIKVLLTQINGHIYLE